MASPQAIEPCSPRPSGSSISPRCVPGLPCTASMKSCFVFSLYSHATAALLTQCTKRYRTIQSIPTAANDPRTGMNSRPGLTHLVAQCDPQTSLPWCSGTYAEQCCRDSLACTLAYMRFPWPKNRRKKTACCSAWWHWTGRRCPSRRKCCETLASLSGTPWIPRRSRPRRAAWRSRWAATRPPWPWCRRRFPGRIWKVPAKRPGGGRRPARECRATTAICWWRWGAKAAMRVRRSLALTHLTAAVAAHVDAAGIYWGGGRLVHDPQVFLEEARRRLAGEFAPAPLDRLPHRSQRRRHAAAVHDGNEGLGQDGDRDSPQPARARGTLRLRLLDCRLHPFSRRGDSRRPHRGPLRRTKKFRAAHAPRCGTAAMTVLRLDF